MLLKPLAAIVSTDTGKTLGLITEDATLAFQIINIALLLLIVIGVPVIIYKLIKSNNRNKKEIEILKNQVNSLVERDNR